MAKLGRYETTVQDSSGNAINSVSVELRKQGATVNADQSGTSPLTITVNDSGFIDSTDSCQIWRTETTAVSAGGGESSFAVDSKTGTTVVLSGFTGTLTLLDEDRLSPTTNLLSLFNDVRGDESLSNPLTTSSLGFASGWSFRQVFDTHLSGGTPTSVTTRLKIDRAVIRQDSPFIYATDFGAVGDGTTDDAAAINAAIAYAGGGLGNPGIVCLRGGDDYAVGSQINLNQNGITLLGGGRNSTRITAISGTFPINTAVIQMGKTDGVFGTTVREMTILCSDIAGSIGVLMDGAQEGSGLERVQISRVIDAGVRITSSFSQHCSLYEVDVALGADAAAVGIDITSTATGSININRGSSGGDVATPASAGIVIAGAQVSVSNTHHEQVADAIRVTKNGAILQNITGHSSVTDVVDTTKSIICIQIQANSATNSINDKKSSPAVVITSDVEYYSVGGDSDSQRICSEPDTSWNIISPMGSSIRTLVDGDTTPPLSRGNRFKTANTSATTITDFDDGVPGQEFTLIFNDANTTIEDGASKIALHGRVDFLGVAGDVMTFVLDGSSWREKSRSINNVSLQNLGAATELTIATAAITATQTNHKLQQQTLN